MHARIKLRGHCTGSYTKINGIKNSARSRRGVELAQILEKEEEEEEEVMSRPSLLIESTDSMITQREVPYSNCSINTNTDSAYHMHTLHTLQKVNGCFDKH